MAKAKEAERTCIVTGETRSRSDLLRFVAGPEGKVVFDLSAKLPGRGIWIVPKRSAVEQAVNKKLFSRAAKEKAVAAAELPDQVAQALRQHALERLSFCRKAGVLVTGFEKVRETVEKGQTAVLIHASDAGDDGAAKLDSKYKDGMIVTCFSRAELGQVTARENAVHLAIMPGAVAKSFIFAARRLTGFDE